MGWFQQLGGWVNKLSSPRGRWRVCRFEQMESRQVLSAAVPALHLGATYFEDASDDDAGDADTFQVSFVGGAAGTQLKTLVINTDKDGDGFSAGDAFFDTKAGGLGVGGASDFKVVAHDGFQVLGYEVQDGGTLLVIHLDGFDAGEKLVFSIDVDERQSKTLYNAIVEGAEFEQSQITGTFVHPNYYDAVGTAIYTDDFTFGATGLPLPPDSYVPPSETPRHVYTAGGMAELGQTPLPISIKGRVYEDANRDNLYDAGETGLANVTLSLYELIDGTYVDTGRTTTTNAAGEYAFSDVAPGTYRVVETQPSGYFSVGAQPGRVSGNTRGVAVGADVLSEITLVGGEDSVENNFGEVRPATLSGHVYHDANNNGIRDAGEVGIANVLLQVYYQPGDGSSPAPISVYTDANGFWSVGSLMPGDYRVIETQPAGYLDGRDAAGTAGGSALTPGDLIGGIVLGSGQIGENYDFGELKPGSISGQVHADLNGNCIYEAGEPLLAGVIIDLLDANGTVLHSTTTDSQGMYLFEGLAPGVYSVRETQPAGYLDGCDHVGTAGGTLVSPDSITQITIGSDIHGQHYDYSEVPPASLSGYVYVDENDNGVKDAGEMGLQNVVVALLAADGTPTGRTATTDANGFYRFDNLRPGTYGVSETQPSGYYDGRDVAGSAGGTALNPGDRITGAQLGAGVNATDYDFGELRPASLSGYVYVDLNQNGVKDAGETPIAGAVLTLLNSNGTSTGRTATTDANGFYHFDNLEPGAYGVAEAQPSGYFDGLDTAGSAGGAALNPGDRITGAQLGAGVNATDYDFGEILPASLSGYVYVDANQNGVRDAGEAPIAGVVLTLLNSNGASTGRTATTDANGFYRFNDLEPGAYGVSEAQPTGYYDGLDAPGSAGGTAMNPGDRITGAQLGAGVNATDYDFGELRPASVRGRIHAELDMDCIRDANEPWLAGVTVYLLNANGQRIGSTVTNANGEYSFVNLAPGVYGVEEVQPAGYLDGTDHVGTAGGSVVANDKIGGITLGSGIDGANYDFCELTPATISGYVFQDGPAIQYTKGEQRPAVQLKRDGILKAGDKRLSGVVLRLCDATGMPILDAKGNPIEVKTDANGYYQFTMLKPGVYSVYEVNPSGYIDGIDTAGSLGGLAVNSFATLDLTIIKALAVDPHDDAILQINVHPGDVSVNNNFSEVLYQPTEPETPQFPTPVPSQPIVQRPQPVAPPPMTYTGGLAMYFPISAPPFVGGGGGPGGETWHLSVINGGQPRSAKFQFASDTNDAELFGASQWTGASMDRGHWIVADSHGNVMRTIDFGPGRGIPVVGDFNGDGKAEVAVFVDGYWFIDLNGDGIWDKADLWAKLGGSGDQPVAGDWDGDGKTDIGIFGPAWLGDVRAILADPGLPDAQNVTRGRPKNVPPQPEEATVGVRTMQRTAKGHIRSDVIDHVFQYGTDGDRPLVGDFNGDGVATIGVFRNGAFFLDMDGNGRWSPDDVLAEFGQPGDIPVIGDWTGDGIAKIGVYRKGTWILDTNNNHVVDATDRVFTLGGPNDLPATGDFDGDGITDVAVYEQAAAEMAQPK